jgi:hypothetical protein
MKTTKPTTRRNFLLAAGLGAGGAVAAVATAAKAPKVASAAPDTAAKSDGYRASPHVMKYYKTTEV